MNSNDWSLATEDQNHALTNQFKLTSCASDAIKQKIISRSRWGAQYTVNKPEAWPERVIADPTRLEAVKSRDIKVSVNASYIRTK